MGANAFSDIAGVLRRRRQQTDQALAAAGAHPDQAQQTLSERVAGDQGLEQYDRDMFRAAPGRAGNPLQPDLESLKRGGASQRLRALTAGAFGRVRERVGR